MFFDNLSQEGESIFKYKYRFSNQQDELASFTRDFAEKTIVVALRNLYGLIGSGRFHIKLIEALDSTVTV